MDISEFDHVVWCDLEVAVLQIHSSSPWDTKMVRTCGRPGDSKPIVHVYICDENDQVFDDPRSYREKIMRAGSYRGHIFGEPARFKHMDDTHFAFSHPDPGKIIWALIIKYVLTVFAVRKDTLHLKGGAVAYGGKAFLILGRGGGGKTEVVKALCANGAEFMGNTHLLIREQLAYGIKSNVRVREENGDVYLPIDQQSDFAIRDGWLPIGGVFWVKYRTDDVAIVQGLPSHVAKANMQFFAEAIQNWEIKEDLADYVQSDPFAFADLAIKVSGMLDNFCESNDVHYANLDIRSERGLIEVLSVMSAR